MPKFDYKGAKAAGYSDEDIAAYLDRKNASGAGLYIDRADLSPDTTRSAPPMMMTPTANPAISFMAGLRGRALEALPSAGGFVGGLGGGFLGGIPGAIGGAAAGGALGEGIRQGASGRPISPLGIAGRGAEQGAYEALGAGIAGGAAGLARPIMRRALGVGRALPVNQFGDVAATALREGVGISPKGIAKIARLRGESSQALANMLAEARTKGVLLNTRAVTQHVRSLLRSNVIPEEEKADITRRLLNFLDDKTARIDPVTLKEIKRFWQNRATAAYKAAPGIMSEALPSQARFAEQLARGAQRELEKIPGVGAREARTQALIGAQRAVEKAYTRPARAIEFHKPGSYPTPFLNSPRAVSNYALFLNSPHFRAFSRQFPRAAMQIFQQLTYEAQPDQTSTVGR